MAKNKQPRKKRNVTKTTRAKLSRSSKLYQKVRKLTNSELEKQGKPLKGKDLTKFIKDNVYPEYKGLSASQVKAQDIADSVTRTLKGVAIFDSGDYYNPFLIPSTLISGVFWFDLDNFIDVDLTAETQGKNLRLEINAGDYGSTGIIDLNEYTYEGSNLSQIIENVRELIGDESEPYWEGEVKVRPNRQDDGNPDSYFLQFTLYVGGQQIKPSATFEEPKAFEMPTESMEERRARRREIVKRRKELAKQRREKVKRKEMRGRPRPKKKEAPKAEKPAEAPAFDEKKAAAVDKLLERQDNELRNLERLYEKKLLTKKEFLSERKAIIDQYTKALDKFKKGGEIK